MAKRARRVFLSYTAQDLALHADAVADVIRRMDEVAVDHRDWPGSEGSVVEACREQVESCDVLVVLVADRYGWVPTPEEGGDGDRSITWHEVAWARARGVPVLAFLASEDADGPTEPPDDLERLGRFKASLRSEVCSRFDTPEDLGPRVERALRDLGTRDLA